MRLVLASKSPRRRQLIGRLDLPVRFVDIDVDEHVGGELTAAEVAEAVAQRKAAAFDLAAIEADEVLVTADTVVVHGSRAIGKPAGREEAIAMLAELSGEKHTVYTGVCLKWHGGQTSFTESTDVFFRRIDAESIARYVDRYQPYDKAGSYGVQEWIGMVGIERIEGCFYNVMGLPTSRLYEALMHISASM